MITITRPYIALVFTEGENRFYAEETKDAVKRGWAIKGTNAKTICAHEMGHVVMHFLIINSPEYLQASDDEREKVLYNDRKNEKTVSKIIQKALSNVYFLRNGHERVTGEYYWDIIGEISGYALVKYSEALAEAFADVYANGENAQEISKEIVKILNDKLKAHEGIDNNDRL